MDAESSNRILAKWLMARGMLAHEIPQMLMEDPSSIEGLVAHVARAAAEEERLECGEACDELAMRGGPSDRIIGYQECAQAIRARSSAKEET